MFQLMHFTKTPNGFDTSFLGFRFGALYIKDDKKTQTSEMLCFDLEFFGKLGFGFSISLR